MIFENKASLKTLCEDLHGKIFQRGLSSKSTMTDNQRQLLLGMLSYLALRDVSPQQVCQLSAIDYEIFTKESSGLSAKQLNDLWKNAEYLCRDPLFGLHFGESLQLAALGIVGEIIKTSNTVGEALTVAAGLVPLITDSFAFEVERARGSIKIFLHEKESGDDVATKKHLADLLLVFTIHELDGLTLEKIQPRNVRLPFLSTTLREYSRVLRCDPTRANYYQLEFSNHYWDLPIITASYELQSFLVKMLSVTTAGAPDSFEKKVREFVTKNSYQSLISLEDVAANFSLTPRSLQRKLQSQGITFQQIADDARKSMALNLLKSGKYQVKEISAMLGYNELSAFSRAFKRWTGKPAGDYHA